MKNVKLDKIVNPILRRLISDKINSEEDSSEGFSNWSNNWTNWNNWSNWNNWNRWRQWRQWSNSFGSRNY